jgi:hypothetical protein
MNADGIDDVLWRRPDGSIDAYLMDGCSVTQTITLDAGADPAWTFAGVGAADANGNAALFWRDPDGDVVLWRVHGGTAVTANTLAAGAFAGWTLAAIGDFDADGKSDIFWRDSAGTAAALWLMNSASHTDVAIAAQGPDVFAAADAIFTGGFDSSSRPAPPLSPAWSVLGAADLDGDGAADVVLADGDGDTALWRMQGATVLASGLIPAADDMPYTAFTGWRMTLDRPTVTLAGGVVDVAWNPIDGMPGYTVYASATNDPAASGEAIASASAALAFGRDDAGFADKRYFAVSAAYLGVQLPPSKEAYIVEYTPEFLPEWGAMAIADVDGDGCVDLLDGFGDCHGNFQVLSESAMGLATLRSGGRQYRDLRYADLDGDGINDLVSNVYSANDDAASQVRFFRGIGNRQFVEDSDFLALGIRGYGETIVIADFNNDGALDIYLPQYSMDSPDDHSWLLLNDGSGHFSDVADLTGVAAEPAANVALRSVPKNCRVEGAQALDIDDDGRIDLYVASHLFLNQGNDGDGVPHFLDTGPRIEPSNYTPATFAYYNCVVTTPAANGLPLHHDEGAKFFDLDNSGALALLTDGAESSEAGGDGVGVFVYDGLGQFVDHSDVFPHFYMDSAWGIQATDVDGDGRADIVLAGGCDASFVPTPENYNCVLEGNPHVPPHLLVNRGGVFVPHDFYQDGVAPEQVTWFDAPAAADFDLSGSVDLVLRSSALTPFLNEATSADTIVVSIVGANGEHNQAGRVVRVSPLLRPDIVMTQVVDGGSGYLANSQYDLTFATPYAGSYRITTRFAGASYTTTARSGQHVTLRANGTYAVQ